MGLVNIDDWGIALSGGTESISLLRDISNPAASGRMGFEPGLAARLLGHSLWP